MNERSFFDFDSQPDDSERLGPVRWGGRFQNLTDSFDGQHRPDSVIEGTFDEDDLPTHGEIIELIEALHAGDSSPFLPKTLSDRPYRVHMPEHYEAGYAYPLILWFHGDGASESELSSVMPNISERNYLGLSVRGNVNCGEGYAWSVAGEQLPKLIDDIESIVLAMRRQYHIHSERIYLAGFGSGATAAMQLILEKPEWFGGGACFCGALPKIQFSQHQIEELRNKRILLATAANSRTSKVSDVTAISRLLYSSGIKIGTRIYQDVGAGPSAKMLNDINHWFMEDVCSTVS